MNKTEIGKFLDAFEAEQLRLLQLDPRERAMQANYSRVMGVMYEVREFLRKQPEFDQQGEQTAPEGFVIVPDADNMTDEQAEAIAKAANCCGGIAYDIYCAAIAAAPKSPEGLKS